MPALGRYDSKAPAKKGGKGLPTPIRQTAPILGRATEHQQYTAPQIAARPNRTVNPPRTSGGGGGAPPVAPTSYGAYSTPMSAPEPGPVTTPAAPIPTEEAFLASDSTLQDALGMYKSLRDKRLTEAGLFEQQTAASEKTAREDFAKEEQDYYKNLLNSFASRGGADSGAYLGAKDTAASDFATQLGRLGEDYARQRTDYGTETGAYNTNLDLQEQQARREAARRYATQYLGQL